MRNSFVQSAGDVEPQVSDNTPDNKVKAPEKPRKKKRKTSRDKEEVMELIDEVVEEPPKKKKKKSKKERIDAAVEELEVEIIDDEPVQKPKKKKKSKKQEEVQKEATPELVEIIKVPESIEELSRKSKKKSTKTKQEETPIKTSAPATTSTKAGEPDIPRGANAVYSTNVIQIPSHVAQKMASMSIHNFKNANIANVVGYGLSEEIEIKTVQTKVGENFNNTDKYSLYNMDRMTTRAKVNPRKIISKLKRTKKSIQVI